MLSCTNGEKHPSWVPRQHNQSRVSNPFQAQAHIPQTQRILTVVAVHHPERLAEALAAIYHASFAEHKEVHTPETLMPIFEKIFGDKETEEIMAKVNTKVIRMSILTWV